MNDTSEPTIPLLDSVLHPTDFSEGSRVAFHHALKAALMAKAKLTLLHVTPGQEFEWMDFPGVRETLVRWGLLTKDSPRSCVPQLGIDVRKVVAGQNDPVKAVLHFLEGHPADFIVLATHQHAGRMHWLRQSVAEPIARQAAQMTLLIPDGCLGFVSAENGSVFLENILIPVAATPDPQPAIAAAALLVRRLNCPRGTFTLLHVGRTETMPLVDCPELPGWEWKQLSQTGDVIEGIVSGASRSSANLIVMATDGRHGFLDALRGSHSERVLRQAPAPLLVVPVGSLASGNLE